MAIADDFYHLRGWLEALRSREGPPGVGGDEVLGNTFTVGVHDPQVVLRNLIALFGRFAIPLHRLGVVLGYGSTCALRTSESGPLRRISTSPSSLAPSHMASTRPRMLGGWSGDNHGFAGPKREPAYSIPCCYIMDFWGRKWSAVPAMALIALSFGLLSSLYR